MSPLPLFNSLTHLTYLTSTSPRIREIMTMDGGLERLVRILHDFCMCPPPPDNPAILYGLSPPNARPAKLVPTLNPTSFDKHAAYRFSLAFQCVVNIGVRGSEPIRSRVVQAGTLDVVGCILEAWLANKGFAVGPSSSATGMPRESREQRMARRQAQADQMRREEADQLARALQRRIEDRTIQRIEHDGSGASTNDENDEQMVDLSTGNSTPSDSALLAPSSSSAGLPEEPPSSATSIDTDPDTSTDTSSNTTPAGSNTPTGSVLVPGRDRSGTIIGVPIWDRLGAGHRHRTHRGRGERQATLTPSAADSRPETETEDDGDVDMDRDDQTRDGDDTSVSPSPEPRRHSRRAVGIVSDAAPAPQLDDMSGDAHIIINDAQGDVAGAEGVGVEEGIVSLEPNDDFAMGAPPGAPGAIDGGTPPIHVGNAVEGERRTRTAPDATPRAGTTNLPMTTPTTMAGRAATLGMDGNGGTPRTRNVGTGAGHATGPGAASHGRGAGHSGSHHRRDADSGPYRDEDVLLSLQLLAYLSKYPHVRQAFYKSRTTFHPASANLRQGPGSAAQATIAGSATVTAAAPPAKEPLSFFRAFASGGRGKEKEKERVPLTTPAPGPSSSAVASSSSGPPRQTNVFSLVERFTFRPSSTETDLPNPPPKLPPEIQYWAGVIMRNACRKDESRGGIRQCANMLCGKWESYPREFAKCRRCRKAKYCGKECQSTAWSEGHRFWCSAKDGEDDAAAEHVVSADRDNAAAAAAGVEIVDGGADEVVGMAVTPGGTVTGRAERRAERDRRNVAVGRTAAGRGTDIVTENLRTLTANVNQIRAANNPPLPPIQPNNGMIGGRTVLPPLYVVTPTTGQNPVFRPRMPVPPNVDTILPTPYPMQFPASGQDSSYSRRRAGTVTGASTSSSSHLTNQAGSSYVSPTSDEQEDTDLDAPSRAYASTIASASSTAQAGPSYVSPSSTAASSRSGAGERPPNGRTESGNVRPSRRPNGGEHDMVLG
ncbi:hypothetical protein PLICRDRAFT_57745 [Plicaturopsis crispa FD-325 SS-3]|uniref:MYND-type domain-containing protein n=1 Tax=Plicaturopsis crispa FD-325 SS-3 TaxID=944288 RepID=A0A0C9T4U0_PLICR|nr:hypothetical protein PLICRDRAFT_57745 [Plicaturopsis crispa FD-325 SS-3]